MDILSRLYNILIDCDNNTDIAVEKIEKEFICKSGKNKFFPYGITDIILNTEEAKSAYKNSKDDSELWDTLEFDINYLKKGALSPVAPGTLFISEFGVDDKKHYEYLIPINYPLIDYRCREELMTFAKSEFADLILSGNIAKVNTVCLSTYSGISPSCEDDYNLRNIFFDVPINETLAQETKDAGVNDRLLYPDEFLGYVSRMCHDGIHFYDIINFSIMVTEKVNKLEFHEINPIVTEIYESKKYISQTKK